MNISILFKAESWVCIAGFFEAAAVYCREQAFICFLSRAGVRVNLLETGTVEEKIREYRKATKSLEMSLEGRMK